MQSKSGCIFFMINYLYVNQILRKYGRKQQAFKMEGN